MKQLSNASTWKLFTSAWGIEVYAGNLALYVGVFAYVLQIKAMEEKYPSTYIHWKLKIKRIQSENMLREVEEVINRSFETDQSPRQKISARA